MSYWKQNQSSV